MPEEAVARLFMNGRSQAVRLPKEFRFTGDRVRVRRLGRGVLLEPLDIAPEVHAWFARLDALGSDEFLPNWVDSRAQPD